MRIQAATGEQGKLDKKAKDQGVLGVVGNPWVKAKGDAAERIKAAPASEYNTINNPQSKMMSEMDRRAI
jgi:hypothetical protein